MFLHMSVILATGRGGGWLPSMHHRSHEQGGLHPVGLCIHGEGRLHPGQLGRPPSPSPTGTGKAGVMHPTGMFPCSNIYVLKL